LVNKKGQRINDNEYTWDTDLFIMLLSMKFDRKLRETVGGLGKTGDFKIELRIYFKPEAPIGR